MAFLSNWPPCAIGSGSNIQFHARTDCLCCESPGNNAIFFAPGKALLHSAHDSNGYSRPIAIGGHEYWLVFGTVAKKASTTCGGCFARSKQIQLSLSPTLAAATSMAGLPGIRPGSVREIPAGRADASLHCGLHPMVDDNRKLLWRKGLDRKRVIFERYD